jgi:3',5'-cyclic AMP phosphodiesterase CpdA
MKKWLAALAAAVSLMIPAALSQAETKTIVLATDMHYLSPSLTDYGERFMETVYASDGKIIQYSAEICKAFAEDMLRLSPDAVILSGDLTLNGSAASLEEFADLMRPLEEAGIQVLAIPGNHDVGGKAYSFAEDGIRSFPAAKAAEYEAIYADYGLNESVQRDEASLSYIAQVGDALRLVMLDVNANGTEGSVREKTLEWLETQLREAQEKGMAVIGVSHQNLLPQNPYYSAGVMINRPQKLRALYEKYGVSLNLSGHTHMQHIAFEGSLTEIVTSSLILTPCQYGVITVEDGKPVSYDARAVDVEAWAGQHGEEKEDLLHFTEYAPAFFVDVVGRKVRAILAGAEIPEEERQRMEDFAVMTSLRDFTGTRTAGDEEADLALWLQYLPNNGFTYYLKGAVAESGWPMVHYDFP